MSLSFTNWSFDQASYVPGSTITLTVNYSSDDLVPDVDVVSAVTVAISDAAGTASQSSDTSGNFPSFTVAPVSDTPQPTTVVASDTQTPPGVWTLVSNTFSGSVAPFAGIAILSGVAA